MDAYPPGRREFLMKMTALGAVGLPVAQAARLIDGVSSNPIGAVLLVASPNAELPNVERNASSNVAMHHRGPFDVKFRRSQNARNQTTLAQADGSKQFFVRIGFRPGKCPESPLLNYSDCVASTS